MSPYHRILAIAPFAAFVLAETAAYTAAYTAAVHSRSGSPRSTASQPALRTIGHSGSRRVDGYLITMQLTDSVGSVSFNMKLAGDAFSLGLNDLIPLMSRGLGGTLGSLADAANMAGSISTATAGAYLMARDSTSLTLVLPTVGMAMSIDPGMIAAAGRQGRGGGPGGRAGGNVGGSPARAGAGGRGRPGAVGGGGGGRQFGGQDISVVLDSTTHVKIDDLGDGEPMLNHPTHHYRIHTSASLIPIAGCRGATSADMIIDGSFASDLGGGAFGRFFSFVPVLDGSGMAAPQGKDTLPVKLPRGFPMKSVASCDTPTRDPVLTLQVIEIDPTSFDPTEFDLPAGVQMINLNGRGGGGRAGGAGGGRRGGGPG